ncbi:MAG: PD40 domain-containing protein [Deltaproteobacteria bacterium]|nr:MAG: PD40 domain-containing protein [Deltaproteobacteria bacterium]
MITRTRGLVAIALALLAPACLGGVITAAEIPGAPIAFVYRTPEEGRRRAELLEQRDRAPQRAGVMQLDDLDVWLDGGSDRRGELLEFAGRMALLDPRTAEVRTFDAVARGAAPLAWSRERERLLFASARRGPAQLFELDLRTEEIRTATRGPAVHASGCYGSDGFLAYSEARRTGNGVRVRIVVREADGRPERALTPGPFDHNPTCPPDGRWILYVSSRPDGREQLMRADLDGSPPRRLGFGRDPAFAPDGSWVVYSAQIGGRWQLWRMRPDGSGKASLGRGVTDEFSPSVSPDGRYVVYESEERGRESLFVRRFDGSEQRVLLSKGDGAHPVWLAGPNAQWSAK